MSRVLAPILAFIARYIPHIGIYIETNEIIAAIGEPISKIILAKIPCAIIHEIHPIIADTFFFIVTNGFTLNISIKVTTREDPIFASTIGAKRIPMKANKKKSIELCLRIVSPPVIIRHPQKSHTDKARAIPLQAKIIPAFLETKYGCTTIEIIESIQQVRNTTVTSHIFGLCKAAKYW